MISTKSNKVTDVYRLCRNRTHFLKVFIEIEPSTDKQKFWGGACRSFPLPPPTRSLLWEYLIKTFRLLMLSLMFWNKLWMKTKRKLKKRLLISVMAKSALKWSSHWMKFKNQVNPAHILFNFCIWRFQCEVLCIGPFFECRPFLCDNTP